MNTRDAALLPPCGNYNNIQLNFSEIFPTSFDKLMSPCSRFYRYEANTKARIVTQQHSTQN